MIRTCSGWGSTAVSYTHLDVYKRQDAATESISAMNDEITNLQFTQDVPIWENKVYRERPMTTKIDGPVPQYRRWFRQFYSCLLYTSRCV